MPKQPTRPETDRATYIRNLLSRLRDETLIVFSFKASQCRRFQMMSHKNRFYKWHFCAVSPLVTKEMSTESGIILGMHKDRLKAILGIPKKDSNEMLVFEYNMNNVSSRTVSIHVEARFVDSELRSFDMSWR